MYLAESWADRVQVQSNRQESKGRPSIGAKAVCCRHTIADGDGWMDVGVDCRCFPSQRLATLKWVYT